METTSEFEWSYNRNSNFYSLKYRGEEVAGIGVMNDSFLGYAPITDELPRFSGYNLQMVKIAVISWMREFGDL